MSDPTGDKTLAGAESRRGPHFAGRFTDWVGLAEGAEGRLYRVTDRWSGRVAALKVGADASAAEAMRDEFRLLSRFRHPCLIESRDLVREGDEVAHLLEYVPAVAPGALWEQGGEDAVWAALTQALRGLAYLHRHDSVHGDVAPGNILVWPEGDRWRAKVADFGLAQSQAEAAQCGPRGTPGYMAPENVRGEGFGPAADLYSLAATAVSWIDGRGPWDDLDPAEALRRAASGADVPAPRRRVSAGLSAVIAALGRGAAADRRMPEWSELRGRSDAWGLPVLSPGVFGLEKPLGDWAEWVDTLPRGRVGAVTVRGRMGSGRSTACRMMARWLVAEGWTALWDLPLEAVRDWLEESAGDPDPVRLARELGRRFADRDVVVVWPEKVGELESRLLRALVVGREQEGSERRTCVMKATSLMDPDDDSQWLESAVRVLESDWRGPSEEGLEILRDDLFSPEDGYDTEVERPAVEAGASPLAAIALKHRRYGGDEGGAAIEGEEAVRRDVDRAWTGAEEPVRKALTILAWSERGWDRASLAKALGWDVPTTDAVEDALGRLALTRRDYDQGALEERITDWLVRTAVREHEDARLTPDDARHMAAALDADASLHPHDLETARLLLAHDSLPRAYTDRALDQALRRGRYESILSLWDALRDTDGASVAEFGFVWEAALRATQKLGRFHDEVTILRALLAQDPEGEEAVERRKMLSHALFAASDWQGAVAECERVIAARGESSEDGLWARIQKAEFLWQTGRFDEARAVYDAVGGELKDNEELFLKYAIGRARMSGQVSDLESMSDFVHQVEARVAPSFFEADPLYFHVKAGIRIFSGDQNGAEPLIAEALRRSEENELWKDYVMIASRAGHAAFELGRIRNAHRIATKALATATALRGEWMSAMASTFLGHYEVYFGAYESAMRHAERALKQAEVFSDRTLWTQGNRLKAFTSAQAGWEHRLSEAVAALDEEDKSAQTSSYARYCEGIYFICREEWSKAKDALSAELSQRSRTGQPDSEALAAAKLAYVSHKLEEPDAAELFLRQALQYFSEDRFPVMRPIAQIAAIVCDSSRTRFSVRNLCDSLEQESRHHDLAYWGVDLLEGASQTDRQFVRRGVLKAIQQVSSDFSTSASKRAYLNLPKIRHALLLLAKNEN